MQWLVVGENLTPAVADALRRHGHGVHLREELQLASEADAGELLRALKQRQWDLLTTDSQLAEAPFALDLWLDRCIVYLQLSGGDVEQDDAIDRLFTRYKRLVPGRLYTVTGSRVKIRQLPSRR